MSKARRRGRPTRLNPRREPTQQRAKDTVRRILDATAELLDEVGLEAVTTNAIAERAGVNVASLYSYFPNKFAVITALAMRSQDARLALLEPMQKLADEYADWRDALDRAIDLMAADWRSEPGWAAIVTASPAIPELQEMHERTMGWLVDRVTSWLQRGGLPGGPKRLRRVATTLLYSVNALMVASLLHDEREAEALLDELKLMLRGYLEHYIH